MKTNLMLCDWAEVIGGKLYMQGGAWSWVVAGHPIHVGLAVVIRVPYEQTNEKHHVELSLVTEDGHPYPAEGQAKYEFDFEVGRPAGMKRGQEQMFLFSANIGGLVFAAGGYRWDVQVNTALEDGTPFVAIER